MSKRRFQDEVDATLAPVLPYLTPEKTCKKGKPAGTSFLPHLVPEEHLMKTNKLPLPPVIDSLLFIDMKLGWDGSQEFSVRAMLDCWANVPVILQSCVDMHKVPGVLRSHTHGLTIADGSVSATNAGQAYTHACTLKCGNHFSQESFESSPLQSAHEILLPWWWIITHPTKYVLTRKDIDMKFDSPICKNCTTKTANEFTIKYDELAAYVDNECKQVGVLRSI